MIRLLLTLALLLALPVHATDAASFQRELSLCADGTRNSQYPAGGASCTPFPPSPAPDYVRRWDDGLSISDGTTAVHGLSDIDTAKDPTHGGYTDAAHPWARTIMASTLEDGRYMLRLENRSNYLDGDGKRRLEMQLALGTAVEHAEIGVPQCWGYPVRYNTGPYADGKSWYAATNWIIAGQNSPIDPSGGPSVDLYAQGQGTGGDAGKIALQLWLREGSNESTSTTTHSYYYEAGNPNNTIQVRGALLDTVYWVVFGIVNDPANTGVGRVRFWVYDVAAREAALAIDPTDLSAGRTLVTDYTGRVGFGNLVTHMQKKTGLYFASRAGASYQADYGTIAAHEIATDDPANNAAALDSCRDVVVASFGALP